MARPPKEPSATVTLKPATRLINKHYWDDIYRLVKERRYATVKDFIDAMDDKGNRDFIEGFPGHFQTINTIQDSFTYSYARHEIAHIAGRIAHSPQQEFLQLAFESGMIAGPRIKDGDAMDLAQFHATKNIAIQRYTKNMANYTDAKPQPLSARDWAIYTAAGMYLREKVDRYLYEHRTMRERQKDKFCDDYALPAMDAELTPLTEHQKKNYESSQYFEQIRSAPASLITLSKQEWRAIEAVALGMCEPEQTDYPKRLAPIKQALIKTGLYFDRPKFVAQLETERQANALNSKGRGQE